MADLTVRKLLINVNTPIPARWNGGDAFFDEDCPFLVLTDAETGLDDDNCLALEKWYKSSGNFNVTEH